MMPGSYIMAGGKKSFQGSVLILVLLLILCFPIGLVYLVIKWQEDTAAMDTRTCMNCGANIAVSYNVCPHCGKPITMYQAPAQQQYQAPPPSSPRQ